MATTTNMELVLATVSTTLGPEWAELINAAFERVDTHDHSTGNGVKITPSGLNINDALSFGDNDATNVNTLGLRNNTATQTSKLGTMQRVGGNLYWVNSAGVAVQITSGNSVNSSGTGQLSVDTPASYPYTITTSDSEVVLLVDSSAARTLTLPAATNTMYVLVKDAGGSASTNNITVSPDGSDTIDGANSDFLIDANYASVGFISDGVSAWYVI